jgi:general secretion pathway protein B
MSLILEALKKAERQHKLGEVPGIGAQPGAATPAGMRGLGWLMLILLAFVMLGLGFYLGGVRLTAPEAGMADGTRADMESLSVQAPDPQPQRSPPVALNPPLEVPPTPLPVTPESPPPKPIPARTLSELPSGFLANLPSLNIDIHSYDQLPPKRYVLINMEKYQEGDYLTEGPQLIEILTDGVILEHMGERFILPIGNQ